MSIAFLIQMGWKSALIVGAALALLQLLRSRSAADRSAVLSLTVTILLALPLAAVVAPALKVTSPLPAPAAAQPAPAVAERRAALSAAPAEILVRTSATPAPRTETHISIAAFLKATYVTGALLLLGRMAMGLITLARWSREAHEAAEPEWAAALARVRIAARVRRQIRLAVSDRIDSPLSWGLVRPVILVDRRSLSRSEDIDAILAHEVAHVARRDWLLLMLARVAIALFWFNPLVWRLERALVQAAEEAADRQAIERVEPLAYASTLVACVRHAGKSGWALPANGMAPRRALKARVEAILDPKQRGRASSGLVTAAAMGLCLAVSAPVAALEVVSPKPPSPLAKPAAKAAPQQRVRPSPEAQPAHARREADPNPNPNLTREEEAAVAREMELAQVEVRIPEIHIPEIRIPEIRIPAVTISEQDVRIPPIDREAIRDAARAGREAAQAGREAGLAGREAGRAAREAARTAREMRGEPITPEQIFGITDERKQAYAQLGYPDLPRKDLVAMAIHGVTPQYIRDMADAGYPGISADMLVQMRIFGISPSAARRAATTQGHPPPEELIKMKIFGTL